LQLIADKVKKVMEAGLRCIYCIGEQLKDREGGTTDAVCAAQMQTLLDAGLAGNFGPDLVVGQALRLRQC
jgi:triosephosphate isomerase